MRKVKDASVGDLTDCSRKNKQGPRRNRSGKHGHRDLWHPLLHTLPSAPAHSSRHTAGLTVSHPAGSLRGEAATSSTPQLLTPGKPSSGPLPRLLPARQVFKCAYFCCAKSGGTEDTRAAVGTGERLHATILPPPLSSPSPLGTPCTAAGMRGMAPAQLNLTPLHHHGVLGSGLGAQLCVLVLVCWCSNCCWSSFSCQHGGQQVCSF